MKVFHFSSAPTADAIADPEPNIGQWPMPRPPEYRWSGGGARDRTRGEGQRPAPRQPPHTATSRLLTRHRHTARARTRRPPAPNRTHPLRDPGRETHRPHGTEHETGRRPPRCRARPPSQNLARRAQGAAGARHRDRALERQRGAGSRRCARWRARRRRSRSAKRECRGHLVRCLSSGGIALHGLGLNEGLLRFSPEAPPVAPWVVGQQLLAARGGR